METTQDNGSTGATPPPPLEDEKHPLRDFVRDAWSQALVAVSTTEDEVQKILGKVTAWVEVGPEEARKLAVDLSDRLKRERLEVERSIESAVQRALAPFRLPTRDQIADLDARLDRISDKLDELIAKKRGGPRR